MYLVSASVAHHNEHGPVVQSESVLNLNTDPIVDLLSKRGHFCRAKGKSKFIWDLWHSLVKKTKQTAFV